MDFPQNEIRLLVANKPTFYVKLDVESAKKADELLEDNHRSNHIFFNNEGFHNHIVHHILSLYALGASPAALESHYAHNKAYQRPPFKVEERVVQDMSEPEQFIQFLGQEKYYHDFVVFFEKEMEKKGWQQVLQDYLFSEDERSQQLLVRTFAGFIHPLIHLGFGIEFGQPVIIAEALAQAAVHDEWIGKYLLPAEKAAKVNPKPKSLFQLLQDTYSDKKIQDSTRWKDPNKVRDGILIRAPDEMIALASQYIVKEAELEEKTAEMINITAYFTGAAQRPPHTEKVDFFLMHSLNSSIFFSAFLKADWLATAHKIRLLEWKGRMDLALYASRGNARLDIREISEYRPRGGLSSKPEPEQWQSCFDAAVRFEDDGHFCKLIRAIANGKAACEKFQDGKDFPIKSDMWIKLAQLATDSVSVDGPTWVRGAGFADAWKDVPLREIGRL
ncbi:hypothetical protein P152DRAFT_454139 [Eremomyces bilateralis CBS 781.70]|uniref:HypA-like protein n=1 Tax=Eremomyces bilateralis CBS 781.70 TaxID=1392243 RepID=A0A6G1GHR9_9PEZI|nr:uncharacterized protein P152DRAFT_454139 [Eremomyces bilateralis CBS 781.70]KAF1817554.1 hypothetical protein P152DRAFT_454139 [Eremomyces bilateralis CBS 781.70]